MRLKPVIPAKAGIQNKNDKFPISNVKSNPKSKCQKRSFEL